MERKHNRGEGKNRMNKMADSEVHPATVLPAAHPQQRAKFGETAGSTVSKSCTGGSGGACMHKTDGKLFCVAAPIPGAGAGEGGE